jgi:uncharacterized protein (TIGR02588 family)
MTPIELRRFGAAGPWWRIHPGSSLGRGRLRREPEEDEGVTRTDWNRNRRYAEVATFALSAAIVLGLLGLVLFESLSSDDRGASISVTPLHERVWNTDGASYLPVEIVNTGTSPATDLRVVIAHPGASAPAEIRLDVLAGGATMEAVVAFPGPPDVGQVSVQTMSYLVP